MAHGPGWGRSSVGLLEGPPLNYLSVLSTQQLVFPVSDSAEQGRSHSLFVDLALGGMYLCSCPVLLAPPISPESAGDFPQAVGTSWPGAVRTAWEAGWHTMAVARAPLQQPPV